jgi:putative spermidine/putrescine transport system substrate-binding protein
VETTEIRMPAHLFSPSLNRRSFLKAAGSGLAASVVAAPFISRAHARGPLRISNFGGFFEQAFADGVYPEFTKGTGIPVQSIPQASGGQFLVQLAQAVQSGSAPMDICCAGQVEVLRGRQQKLWKTIETNELANVANVPERYMFASDTGVDGIGAMGWYLSFIADPTRVDPLPTSWKELWGEREGAWGVYGGGASPIMDITSAIYFDGPQTLRTTEGIDAVLGKVAELRSKAALWWTEEGTMQSAFQNGEVLGGMYYHDVAMIMKGEGTSLESIFPEEGALQGYNGWCVPASNEMTDEIKAFLDWSATPECHQAIARKVLAAPLLPRSMLDLTDQEFAAVATEAESILLDPLPKVEHADYLAQQFLAVVAS